MKTIISFIGIVVGIALGLACTYIASIPVDWWTEYMKIVTGIGGTIMFAFSVVAFFIFLFEV